MSESTKEPHVISTSTIFILSGFLLGMTINQFIGANFTPYLIAAGLSGFMAFIVLDLSAARRTQIALQAEREEMESRLDRHMHSLSSVGFILDSVSSVEMDAVNLEEQPATTPDQVVTSVTSA